MKISKSVLLILFLLFHSVPSPAQVNKYVILISFDGFRWDYANRGLSPNLEKMKAEGVSALSLRPAFPSKTFPNHYSIITGMYPENHGIIANNFENPFTGETYGMSDTISTRDPKWYLGEAFWETAERNGIITASYFWPGSELNDKSRRPSYFKHYKHDTPYEERVDAVLNWLSLPMEERPNFITLYFHDTDSYGHRFGPDSEEIKSSIARLDSILGRLRQGLKSINLFDSTNVIVVSDHGMTNVKKGQNINIEKLLDEYKFEYSGEGPLMMVYPQSEQKDKIYQRLLAGQNHYKVYLKENIPDSYNFSKHPFISDIILISDPGWNLVDTRTENKLMNYTSLGNHGWDKDFLDMHGIFIASGPDFKINYPTGTLWNIDIYPLLCKIFNIEPRSNIDGKLERIEFLLKDY